MVSAVRPALETHERAERAVLGALLLRASEVLAQIADVVVETDFHGVRHRAIFHAVLELDRKSAPVDPLTVAEEVQREAGGHAAAIEPYCVGLLDECPTTEAARHYAQIVADHAALRQLEAASREIAARARGGEVVDAREFIQDAAQQIGSIADARAGQRATPVPQVVDRVLRDVEARSLGRVKRVPTGLRDLDALAIVEPKDLVVIAGAPGSGKTSLATQIVSTLASDAGSLVQFVSIEMSDAQVIARMLSSESGINLAAMRQERQLDALAFIELARAGARVTELGLALDTPSRPTMLDLRALARRAKRDAERGAKRLVAVAVDYLQKIRWHQRRSEGRAAELDAIVSECKAIAKDFDCVVFLVSALNREHDKRNGDDRRPRMSDLRGTSAIEYEADHVWLLWRHEQGAVDLVIAKQRNGPQGTVTLAWKGETTRFADAEQGWDAGASGDSAPADDYASRVSP